MKSFASIVISCIWLFSASVLNAENMNNYSPPFEKEYRVVLMLPFCLGMPEKYKIRDVMVEYYEGVEIAISELEEMGIRMNLTVLDTRLDSLEVIRLLSDPEMQKTDLFIGPVYDKELVEVEKFCAIYKIPLVSPLRYYPNTLGADFPLINCNAVDTLQNLYNGKMAASAFRNFQVIILDDLGKNLNASANRNFKKGYELNSGKSCSIIDPKVTPIESAWNSKDSLLLVLTGKSSSACNMAIAANRNNKWIVMGPAEWLSIDRPHYNVLNGIYFYDTYSVLYNDTTYKTFHRIYRERFGGDPERYTFIGYDQFLFFGTALMAFDDDFYKRILNKEFKTTHRTFNFVRRGNLIENSGTNLFYYNDYNFYKALWRY